MKLEPRTSEEYDRFTSLVDRVLSVPHSEIKRRMEEYKKESEQNPNRRGPKPKARGEGPTK
jgi:hypothetical protein